MMTCPRFPEHGEIDETFHCQRCDALDETCPCGNAPPERFTPAWADRHACEGCGEMMCAGCCEMGDLCQSCLRTEDMVAAA